MNQRQHSSQRHFERREVSLPACLETDPPDRARIRSQAIPRAESRLLHGRIADVSTGGIGLMTPHFAPRGTTGWLLLMPDERADEGEPTWTFRHRVVVKRVFVIGGNEGYFLGTSFLDPAPDLGERIAGLMPPAHDGGQSSAMT